jgi:hypothetical protein
MTTKNLNITADSFSCTLSMAEWLNNFFITFLKTKAVVVSPRAYF